MAKKAETLTTRVTRLEELAQILLEAQMKTDAQIRETDRRLEKLGKELDDRIEKLVIAIGELIRQRSNGPILP